MMTGQGNGKLHTFLWHLFGDKVGQDQEAAEQQQAATNAQLTSGKQAAGDLNSFASSPSGLESWNMQGATSMLDNAPTPPASSLPSNAGLINQNTLPSAQTIGALVGSPEWDKLIAHFGQTNA